jgi:hypothetical protein
MKQNKLIIILAVISIYSFALTHKVNGCSMFKVTMYGKTMVGNNEDYWNPNTRIWFERGKDNEYGVVFVGYADFWPQGGMNQAGLVFDGFAMPYLAINDRSGKKELSNDFLRDIMKKCTTVDEVKKYFAQCNLTGLETSMFLFIDKTGKYIVVEGDSLITGNNQCYVLSNFYPSQVKDESKIDIPIYQKGKRLLESRRDTSISFCASVMDTMHQETKWGGGTLYTTLYDLKDGIIYLYFFHDYDHVVKFNLNQELEKSDHILVIPELFPENEKGLEFLNNYNEVSNEIDLFKNEDVVNDSVRFSNVVSTLFSKDVKLICRFEDKINQIGNVWLDKKKYVAAISVFKLNIKASPTSWNAYDALADAYMKNKQFEPALANYEKSIEINPDNSLGKQQIKILEELIKR